MIELTEKANRLLRHLKSANYRAGDFLGPGTLNAALGSNEAGIEAARELVLVGLLYRGKDGNLSVSLSAESLLKNIEE
jgi:hypothetical protein